MLEEEPVLVIPEVLALLGDNPMQSEFACHIGLRGKFFCRACWVKGTDAMDNDDEPGGGGNADSDHGSVAGSDAGSAANSDHSDAGEGDKPKRGRGKKIRESMAQMVDRVKSFMKVSQIQ